MRNKHESKQVRLKDICLKIGSGATPRGGREAYVSDGISLIRSQNVLDFIFSSDGLAHITEKQATKLNNAQVENEDILFNITGDSVCRACSVDPIFLPARVNQHVAIIRADKNKVYPTYLLYFLQWKKEELLQIASGGATRNAITKQQLENLILYLPTLYKQKKLISILDCLNTKIGINKKINDNLAA